MSKDGRPARAGDAAKRPAGGLYGGSRSLLKGPGVPPPSDPPIRLLDGAWYADDPHRHFAWMREHAPVHWDEAGQVWGVARYDDVLRVSKDPLTFCSRHGSRPDSPAIPSMINMDDPEHRRRRALVNKGLTPRRVLDHEPKIRAICHELVDRVAPLGACDFVHDVAAPLPMMVIGDLLGVEPEDRDMLLRWSDDLIEGTSVSAPPETMMRAMRAFEEYADYHRKVVADRRAHPRSDMMSILVHAEIDGERLDADAILQESLLLLVGGDETTRHVITGGMEALLRNPGERRKLAADAALMPSAVEEMLRWVTPIQNMNRTATRDVELGGMRIRAGDKVLPLYPSANRDERAFPRAHELHVDRTPNEHLAFGHGAHFCLGASLARLELKVMFEVLLERLPDLELASDAPLALRPSNFIVGIASMPVTFAPR
jgi:cytochrome P450 family 142 subfamily A polypeptide 1